jgi:hypothetical protein
MNIICKLLNHSWKWAASDPFRGQQRECARCNLKQHKNSTTGFKWSNYNPEPIEVKVIEPVEV